MSTQSNLVAALRAPSWQQDSAWYAETTSYATKPRALLDAAADALEATATSWRPIDGAPTDAGFTCLLWFPDLPTNELQVGVWRRFASYDWGVMGEWVDRDNGDAFETVGDGQVWPTHWQPLPTPPASPTGSEASAKHRDDLNSDPSTPPPEGV